MLSYPCKTCRIKPSKVKCKCAIICPIYQAYQEERRQAKVYLKEGNDVFNFITTERRKLTAIRRRNCGAKFNSKIL